MNLIINNLLIPIEKDCPEEYLQTIAGKLQIAKGDIRIVKMLGKALQLQNLEQFYFKISLVFNINDGYLNPQNLQIYNEQIASKKIKHNIKDRPIIVGFGPAGMFAALELIKYGFKPVIFERGKKIDERSVDVKQFIKDGKLNPESNIQFGEGGAGSYSDGKLFSRRNNNSSSVNQVLQTFIKFGAPPEIGYISKPHLGTDMLCVIVRNIRRFIIERGADIHYSARMTDIIISDGIAKGVIINDKNEYFASRIYIALGHSARDTFEMMSNRGVAMAQKTMSVGLRIEHPAETINQLRYGDKYKNYQKLGAATYSLNYTNRKLKRGVYTFCMCPGGEIVNASSEPEMLALNGMSYSTRSSKFSNAALIVNCHISDYKSNNPLAGIKFQQEIERKTFRAGGGNWQAPGQNLFDFLGLTNSSSLNLNSYKMGVVPADLKDILPEFAVTQLLAAFAKWRNDTPLFVTEEAILLGSETRISSPVKIVRNEKYESINIKNLYPIGEGAGYAGGITSSAADAIKAVSLCTQ